MSKAYPQCEDTNVVIVYKRRCDGSNQMLNWFPLNKACSKEQNNHRRFYTIKYKLQVVDYAKEHRNRAAVRSFGPPPTKNLEEFGEAMWTVWGIEGKIIGKVKCPELEELKP